MLRRIVEISGEGRKLTLDRGFLSISSSDGLLGQVPLDDVEAVIAASTAISYTNQALAALAMRGAPVVICGPNYCPIAWLLPVDGHHAQGERMEAQAEVDRPTRKRIWSDIVAAKINAQAQALEARGHSPQALLMLLRGLRSGDAGNIEALAAQQYFATLFGRKFRRDRDQGGTNALLNYGYTVLRAATARAIVAAGLHPSLSVFHKSRGDALRLADDLMEPFRPSVDLAVIALVEAGAEAVDTGTKRSLVRLLHNDFATDEGRTPLSNCLVRLATSLAQIYLGERKKLILPSPLIPLPDDAEEDE